MGESWDDMPVNVRELVAEQLVVDLDGIEHDGQRARDFRDFFYELAALFPREVEQLGRMPLEHQHRSARKELIIMQVGDREPEFGDLVILPRPPPCTDFTGHEAGPPCNCSFVFYSWRPAHNPANLKNCFLGKLIKPL